MPVQLFFRCGMVLNTLLSTDWEYIRIHKQELIYKNNQRWNINIKFHNYIVYNKVLLCDKKVKKYEDQYKSLYPITNVSANVTVVIF